VDHIHGTPYVLMSLRSQQIHILFYTTDLHDFNLSDELEIFVLVFMRKWRKQSLLQCLRTIYIYDTYVLNSSEAISPTMTVIVAPSGKYQMYDIEYILSSPVSVVDCDNCTNTVQVQ